MAPNRPPFEKVLIANRGEIAVRIARGLRDCGILPVAIFSEADRGAPHVRAAAEAYLVGGAAAADSYLRVERIVDVAKKCGAEAIHPGYGFLSESPLFARAVRDAGLVWIGPTPEAMEKVGDKLAARATVGAVGVPIVPGSLALEDPESALSEAMRIGFPLLVKASAGGGGKGMRTARNPEELNSALRAARSEGKASFGKDTVYLERLIEGPRHIEIQILGDHHGNIVHLGERECSVQRRHQKVLEESPSPAIDPATRQAMGDAAVAAARAAGYTNAGTCEFLLDNRGRFYFLEVNARLQVEHPVTELRTGLDLVALQVRVAGGAELPFTQEEVRSHGHAIEVRIYAEDADRGYLPSPGTVSALREPTGPGVRVDSGIDIGFEVTANYDPILAKLIVWGQDRSQAIARMRRALDEYWIGGLTTNLALHRRILVDPRFVSGEYDTSFLETLAEAPADPADEDLAALTAALYRMLGGGDATASDAVRARTIWKQSSRIGGLRSSR